MTPRRLPCAALLALAACQGPASGPQGAPDGGAADGRSAAFTLTSSSFMDGGTLPVDFTCDGAGRSPPLSWSDAPPGTAEYALLMTTLARDGLKWNWVLHSIPAAAASLAAGSMGVGVAGITSDGPNLTYYPPCSQGPGAKEYTFTIYALSAHPELPMPASKVTGGVLGAAIGAITLASSKLTVSYTR